MAEQLRTTEAHLAVKTNALEELERKLAQEKAELKDLMAFIDARDKLAEADSRHAAAMDALRAEKTQVEEQLAQSREECAALQQDMAVLKKQVEVDLGVGAHGERAAARAHQRRRRRSRAGRPRARRAGLADRHHAGRQGRRARRREQFVQILPTAMTPRACSPTASAPCRSARRGCHRPEDHRQG